MDHNTILVIVVLSILLYFHFQLYASRKKLKLEIESNIQTLLTKAVQKEINILNLVPASEGTCNHTYVVQEKLQVIKDKDHIGNVYISRCSKCGDIVEKSVYVNN